MEYRDSLDCMPWGTNIYQHIKICHKIGENHFIGINGPVGIGKRELINRISKDIGREFIHISYSDITLNTSFLERYRNKDSALYYIDNVTIENGVYPELIKGFMSLINLTDFFKNSIFVFSSNVILGTNAAINIQFRLFLYGRLSMREKVLYAKTVITELQRKWNMDNVYLPDNIIEIIIKHYTKEAGINYLSVLIKNLYEVIYYEDCYKKDTNIIITNRMVFRVLGSGCYAFDEQIKTKCLQGVGMAWTKWGGTLLPIEIVMTKGNENITFSGNIGSLMRESFQVIFTYLKVNCEKWKIATNYFSRHNFHINIYEQELSKDGVSAGLAFFVKLLCMIKKIRFQQAIAFSGEVSLEGRILRVGGLKEKLCTVQEHGIKKVVLPKQSWPEYQLLPLEVKDSLVTTFIDDIGELEKIIQQEKEGSGYGKGAQCQDYDSK